MPTKQPEKKGKVVVQYFHDGRPISAYQNKLSSIAYWYTAGIRGARTNESGHEALTSKQLVALLIKLGAEDPKTKAFDVTLPNGVRIHSKIGKLLAPAPRAKKAAAKRASAKKRPPKKTGPAKTTAKKAVKNASAKSRSTSPKAPRRPTAAQRAERLEQAKNEGALLKAWEEGGMVGERPLTPAIDAMEAQPSKGAEAVAKQGQGVKPTNKDKKVPRQRKSRAKPKDTPEAETPTDPRDGGGAEESEPAEATEEQQSGTETIPEASEQTSEQSSEMASV